MSLPNIGIRNDANIKVKSRVYTMSLAQVGGSVLAFLAPKKTIALCSKLLMTPNLQCQIHGTLYINSLELLGFGVQRRIASRDCQALVCHGLDAEVKDLQLRLQGSQLSFPVLPRAQHRIFGSPKSMHGCLRRPCNPRRL